MKVLIIGGAGYLGLPLSDIFIERDFDVTVYDNFTYTNLTYLKNKVKVISDDVKNIEKYEKKISEFDLIYYLVSPRLGELNHEYQIEEPINLFEKTLRLVNKKTKFVFTSSCSVYGSTKEFVNEKSELQKTSLYSKLKIRCEQILLSKNNPNFKIVRLSTLYGESRYIRNDIFINELVNDYKNGRMLKIFDPESARPNLHVKDCASLLFHFFGENCYLTGLVGPEPLPNIINIGFNELNTTKRNIAELIKEISSNQVDIKYVDSEDSRSYTVDFSLMKRILSHHRTEYKDGIKRLIEYKPIIASIEDWDSVLDYYLPNSASKTWYMLEERKLDYPKVFGVWSIFNIEDNFKLFDRDTIKEITTPYFDEHIVYLTKDKIGDNNHLYLINVWDNSFFRKNRNIGFKCLSEQYINDVKNNKCKIVMIHHFEGYSGSSQENDDLEIIDSWINELQLPHENVYYIHGNLLIDEVRKQRGLKFKCYPISIFDSWVDFKIVKQVIDFKPKDNKNLILSYNRKPRPHRVYLVKELIKYGLFDRGKISLGHFEFDEEEQPADFEEISKMTPILIDRTLDINWAPNIEVSDFEDTFISIVTETLVDESVLFISEKIWKPIVLGHPFLIMGNVGTLTYLKSLGFKTYDRWIDESYDQEIIHFKRVDMIVNEVNKFKDKTIEELQQIRQEMREVCEFNRNNFIQMVKNKYFCNQDDWCDNKKPIIDIYKTIYNQFNN